MSLVSPSNVVCFSAFVFLFATDLIFLVSSFNQIFCFYSLATFVSLLCLVETSKFLLFVIRFFNSYAFFNSGFVFFIIF